VAVGAKTSLVVALVMSAAAATGGGVGAALVLQRNATHAAHATHATHATREAAPREGTPASTTAVRTAATPGAPSGTSPAPAAQTRDTLPGVAAPAVQPAVASHAALAQRPAPARPAARARVLSVASSPGAHPAASSAAPPAPGAGALGDELALLRGAQDALRAHDGVTALGLLEQHAARFPQGMLREERLATQVLALCTLERLAEARAAAQVFLGSYPHSPHARRVRASCVGQNP
jgi:hypothetical protein